MSLFRTLDISASGLHAGRLRMDVIAHNIANVESPRTGTTPFRRKEVVMAAQPMTDARLPRSMRHAAHAGVQVVGIRQDPAPLQPVYRPEDPAADAQGYVYLSNVNLPMEMVDMVAASRAYEANAAAFRTGREMVRRALDIMR